MATKIVRFKDGTYAARRWRPFFYQYLDNDCHSIYSNIWWPSKYAKHAKVGTYELAVELLDKYLQRKNEKKDYGTPVNKTYE